VLIVALVLSWRWTRALVVGSLIFFLAISPTLGFVGYSWVTASDKYVYLPSIGLVVVLGWLLGRCWSTPPGAARFSLRRIAVFAVVLILAGAESIATRSYLLHWQDTEGLCRYMLERAPKAPMLHLSLGNALADRGDLGGAIHHYRLALQFKPDFSKAHSNLGLALAKQGKSDEAIQHYRRALQLTPNLPEAHSNLGLALAEQGKSDEAIQHYRRALQLTPNLPEAHNNLGLALAGQGKGDEAVRHYIQALRLKPEFPMAYNNLGVVLVKKGKTAEAIRNYRQALQLNPELPEAHNNLGTALTRQGKHDEAISHYKWALQLRPDFAEAHGNLGNALLQQGRVDEALQHYKRALQLEPDSPDALNNLAWALATHDIAVPPDDIDPVQLAERACEHSDYKRPDFLDTLAACYAAANRFPDAVTTVKKAIELAASAGQARLAEDIRARLKLYETGRPYRALPKH